jgi:hypothetical protein
MGKVPIPGQNWWVHEQELDAALAAEVVLRVYLHRHRRIPIHVLIGRWVLEYIMHKSFAKSKDKTYEVAWTCRRDRCLNTRQIVRLEGMDQCHWTLNVTEELHSTHCRMGKGINEGPAAMEDMVAMDVQTRVVSDSCFAWQVSEEDEVVAPRDVGSGGAGVVTFMISKTERNMCRNCSKGLYAF